MAVLLVGALLGRPVPALLLLAGVAGFDGWLRVERLDVAPLGGAPVRKPSRFLLQDGSLPSSLRWASLAAAVAVLFVFPVEDLWRF
jgi:hypothetical protein